MTILATEISPAAAKAISFGSDHFTVKLTDGRSLSVPLAWYPRLLRASARERANWRLIGGGTGLHWPDIEEDISVQSLIKGQRSMESDASFAKWLVARS